MSWFNKYSTKLYAGTGKKIVFIITEKFIYNI